MNRYEHESTKKRSTLKSHTVSHGQGQKSVVWDWKSLEEQEQERLNNPRQKINEPKTPYLPYVSQ